MKNLSYSDPCGYIFAFQVIFIDEIDAIAPARGGSSGQGNNQSPVSARLVTTLLTELDSIRGEAHEVPI